MTRRKNKRVLKKKRFLFIAILSFVLVFLFTFGFFITKNIFQTDKKTETISQKKQVTRPNPTISSTSIPDERRDLPEVTIDSSSTLQPEGNQISLNDVPLKASANQVYYSVYYFNTGDYTSSKNSEKTTAASIIKVFIMEYVFSKVQSQEISLTDNIEGSSLAELVKVMIQKSDNNASNSLITHFGMEELNSFFVAQGYDDTKLERLMLDNEARNQGMENYTSLNDSMSFLKKIYYNRSAFPYSDMIEILKGQTIRNKIPSLLPQGTVVANKTGELETVENDVGIVFSEDNPFALVILTDSVVNLAETRLAIGNFALSAFQYTTSE